MHRWLDTEWARCIDFQMRDIEVCGTRITLFWLRGIVDLLRLETGIMQPLESVSKRRLQLRDLASVLHTVIVREISTLGEFNAAVTDGQVVLRMWGTSHALVLEVSDPPGRPLSLIHI